VWEIRFELAMNVGRMEDGMIMEEDRPIHPGRKKINAMIEGARGFSKRWFKFKFNSRAYKKRLLALQMGRFRLSDSIRRSPVISLLWLRYFKPL
jgi:hypothetical protein